jgi:hypothetical protein
LKPENICDKIKSDASIRKKLNADKETDFTDSLCQVIGKGAP